jgi:hypothetical protein
LRPHDFQCIKALVLEVKSEPNCREVSPTHFLENDVPVVQDLPKLCVMIILLVSLTRYALSDSHPLCSLSGLPSAHLRNHHLYRLHAYPSFFLLFWCSVSYVDSIYNGLVSLAKYLSSLALAPF